MKFICRSGHCEQITMNDCLYCRKCAYSKILWDERHDKHDQKPLKEGEYDICSTGSMTFEVKKGDEMFEVMKTLLGNKNERTL